MSVAGQIDFVAGLLECLEVNTVRQNAQHLIQQMHHVGAIALQFFHGILAHQQRLRLLAQFLDFIDLLVQHRDFLLQVSVAPFLIGYFAAEPGMHERHQQYAQRHENSTQCGKLDLAGTPLFGAVRQ